MATVCCIVIGCNSGACVLCDWLVQRRACLGPVSECLGRIVKTVERGFMRGGDALPSIFCVLTVLKDEVFANFNSGVF